MVWRCFSALDSAGMELTEDAYTDVWLAAVHVSPARRLPSRSHSHNSLSCALHNL